MRMPTLTCNRCGAPDTMMVDAPRLDDSRVYCIECYAYLFPPGWTDEYQPLTDPVDEPPTGPTSPETPLPTAHHWRYEPRKAGQRYVIRHIVKFNAALCGKVRQGELASVYGGSTVLCALCAERMAGDRLKPIRDKTVWDKDRFPDVDDNPNVKDTGR